MILSSLYHVFFSRGVFWLVLPHNILIFSSLNLPISLPFSQTTHSPFPLRHAATCCVAGDLFKFVCLFCSRFSILSTSTAGTTVLQDVALYSLLPPLCLFLSFYSENRPTLFFYINQFVMNALLFSLLANSSSPFSVLRSPFSILRSPFSFFSHSSIINVQVDLIFFLILFF